MKHRRPPRLPDAAYIGPVRIFFTMCTFHRRTSFVSRAAFESAYGQLVRTADECAVEIIAHCFMPDHLHMLMAGLTESSDLKQCADLFRRRAGRAYRRLRRERLWQEGYFDQSLRETDATFDVVCYILANPVRAGLCARPSEYEFMGSSRYAIEDLLLSVQWRPDHVD
jgi:putative transposase